MNEALDHIVWICDDLERGSRQFEDLTGVAPIFGGVHASGVTENAIIGLGARRYLEILAPVPGHGSELDEWARLASKAKVARVLTYCLRGPHPLEELARATRARGWKNANVEENGRTRPDGVRLQWQWLAPVVEPFGVAFPFFIDWLDSVHPSESAPASEVNRRVSLQGFSVGHPQAQLLARTLHNLGFSVDTFEAPKTSFRVQLDTPRGPVLLA
jgi:hypothetical protein